MLTDSKKERNAVEWVRQARVLWEKQYPPLHDYLTDRDVFYKYVRKEVLPKYLEAGGDEEVFLKAIAIYAREDWVRCGFDPIKFDHDLKLAKQHEKPGILGGVFREVLRYILVGFIILALRLAITSFIEGVPEDDLRRYVGYANNALFFYIVAIIIYVVVKLVHRQHIKSADDNITSLKF